MELSGIIDEQGKPKIFRKAELDQWFLDNKGKPFTMTVARKKKKRSNSQNEYYWGCVIPMVQAAMNSYGSDYSKEETHEFLKKEFNWMEIEVNDNYIKVPQSTTKLSTSDFMTYLDKIYLFASEVLGIEIPLPETQMTMKLTVYDPSLPHTTIHDNN